MFQRVIGSRSLALRVEGTIKRLSKARKEELVVQGDMAEVTLSARSARKVT